VRFKRAIIATGSRPQPPPGGWPKAKHVTDWLGAWRLEYLPKSLLVVGGGSIAIEMAAAFATLGTDVTLAGPASQLLSAIDAELVEPVEKRLAQMIARIHVGTTVTAYREVPEGIEARLEGEGAPPRQVFEHVLVALGNVPNTADLGLDKAKIKVHEDGSIRVDDQLRTVSPCWPTRPLTRPRWRRRSSRAGTACSSRGPFPVSCTRIRRSPGAACSRPEPRRRGRHTGSARRWDPAGS
jgi:dihydrolipoamide dehydrogenase